MPTPHSPKTPSQPETAQNQAVPNQIAPMQPHMCTLLHLVLTSKMSMWCGSAATVRLHVVQSPESATTHVNATHITKHFSTQYKALLHTIQNTILPCQTQLMS